MEEVVRQSKGKQVKSFFMTSTNGMAIGLFGTLIIGTILDLFVKIPGMSWFSTLTTAIKGLMGAGIGIGVALALKQDGIKAVTMMAAGFVGNYAFQWFGDKQWTAISIGDPLSCYCAAILVYFFLNFAMKKKTPVDMILLPLVGLLIACSYSVLLAPWVHYVTVGISYVVRVSFDAVPFLMCIIISVLMGMALTSPISSVAICVAINIGEVPLAAASALIGCCTQMVGFAISSRRDNKIGIVLAIGIGTSMLQFKNIIRKPTIWLPTIIVSALLGPFAMLFPLNALQEGTTSALSVGAGMGTSGLVGPINFLGSIGWDNWVMWVLIFSVCLLGPALLVFLVDLLFRRFGWIKEGDYAV